MCVSPPIHACLCSTALLCFLSFPCSFCFPDRCLPSFSLAPPLPHSLCPFLFFYYVHLCLALVQCTPCTCLCVFWCVGRRGVSSALLSLSLSCSDSFSCTFKGLIFSPFASPLLPRAGKKRCLARAFFVLYYSFYPSLSCAVRASDNGINTTAATYIAPPFPFFVFTPPSVAFARPYDAGLRPAWLPSCVTLITAAGPLCWRLWCACGFFPFPVNGVQRGEDKVKRNGRTTTASSLSLCCFLFVFFLLPRDSPASPLLSSLPAQVVCVCVCVLFVSLPFSHLEVILIFVPLSFFLFADYVVLFFGWFSCDLLFTAY